MLSKNAYMALPTAMAIAVGCGSSNAVTAYGSVDSQAEEQMQAQLPADSQIETNSSVTGVADWNVFDRLRVLYTVSNPDQVFLFLNDQIANLLLGAEAVIREHFEPSKIALDLRSDPEGNSEILLVSIHTDMHWERAEERLDNFDRCWWLSKSWIPSSKRICIDVRA